MLQRSPLETTKNGGALRLSKSAICSFVPSVRFHRPAICVMRNLAQSLKVWSRRLDTLQLQMVKLILETGSFYKTAIRMNCAQSVVSRQLAALEHECGERFFHRNARCVRLTDFGEQMLPQIDIILAAAHELTNGRASLSSTAMEDVKIAIGPQISSYLSGRLYNELKQSHPNIRLSISEAIRDTVRSDLREGRVDIAVLMRSGRAVGHDDRVICPVDTCLVGLPDSPATANDTIEFADLVGLPLLLQSQPSEWRSSLEAAATRTKINLTVVAEANASTTRAALVRDGVGYLIAPLLRAPSEEPLGWIATAVAAGQLRTSVIINPTLPADLVVSVAERRSNAVDLVASLISGKLTELVRRQQTA